MIPHVFLLNLLRQYEIQRKSSSQDDMEKLSTHKDKHKETTASCKKICDIKHAYIQNIGKWIECHKKCKTEH